MGVHRHGEFSVSVRVFLVEESNLHVLACDNLDPFAQLAHRVALLRLGRGVPALRNCPSVSMVIGALLPLHRLTLRNQPGACA